MTPSHIPSGRPSFTAPVVDYEPPPITATATLCPPPSPSALHRHTRRRLRPVPAAPAPEPAPPRAAGVFAEAALRRVLEVIDRRRPVAQLRPLLAPALVDTVATLSRASAGSRDDAAVLRRVRLRTAVRDATDHDGLAAEVFATYTRGTRVRAIAARVESVHDADRWQLVALQVG